MDRKKRSQSSGSLRRFLTRMSSRASSTRRSSPRRTRSPSESRHEQITAQVHDGGSRGRSPLRSAMKSSRSQSEQSGGSTPSAPRMSDMEISKNEREQIRKEMKRAQEDKIEMVTEAARALKERSKSSGASSSKKELSTNEAMEILLNTLRGEGLAGYVVSKLLDIQAQELQGKPERAQQKMVNMIKGVEKSIQRRRDLDEEEMLAVEASRNPFKDPPYESRITDIQTALRHPNIKTFLPVWQPTGERSVPAKTWLTQSIQACHLLGFSVKIMPQIISGRLQDKERAQMAMLFSLGRISSLEDFQKEFLGLYGQKKSGLQMLRDLMFTKMTQEQVSKQDYVLHAINLLDKAHLAYSEIPGLKKTSATYDILDRVIVCLAYLLGVPQELTEHLALKDLQSIDEMVEESKLFAAAQLLKGSYTVQ